MLKCWWSTDRRLLWVCCLLCLHQDSVWWSSLPSVASIWLLALCILWLWIPSCTVQEKSCVSGRGQSQSIFIKWFAELLIKHSLKAFNLEDMLQNLLCFFALNNSYICSSSFCYLRFPRGKKLFCIITGIIRALFGNSSNFCGYAGISPWEKKRVGYPSLTFSPWRSWWIKSNIMVA